ncbi:hypothetical protein HYDPIDRAFT_107995 [Hydnomerulius pinastri MD-312]|nr:hypothetical protein HYDPIDRAFT_107995 [Hydnomerulius pinastri MD-312]
MDELAAKFSRGLSLGNTSDASVRAYDEALRGLVTRQVTAGRVRRAMDHPVNPFTGVPYTAQYKGLLGDRRKLPVYANMGKFYEIFNKNQVMVVVGEAGTGKTTQ